jgi:hypothetical protein
MGEMGAVGETKYLAAVASSAASTGGAAGVCKAWKEPGAWIARELAADRAGRPDSKSDGVITAQPLGELGSELNAG